MRRINLVIAVAYALQTFNQYISTFKSLI